MWPYLGVFYISDITLMCSIAVPISLFADYTDTAYNRYRLCSRLWHRLWMADYEPIFSVKTLQNYYFALKYFRRLFLLIQITIDCSNIGTDYAYGWCIGTSLICSIWCYQTPLDLPSPPHLYVLFTLLIDETSLFPGLGQLWLSLGLSLLLVPTCGIVFCLPLAIPSSLLIYPPP